MGRRRKRNGVSMGDRGGRGGPKGEEPSFLHQRMLTSTAFGSILIGIQLDPMGRAIGELELEIIVFNRFVTFTILQNFEFGSRFGERVPMKCVVFVGADLCAVRVTQRPKPY